MRHPFVATREQSLLLVIDFQQAMQKAMGRWGETARRVNQLSGAAALCEVPVVVTEHYRKGLGETAPEVLAPMREPLVLQKDHFSACLEAGFVERLRTLGRDTVVLAGMETHVCVLQTGLDLLQAGFRVQLVADAVASRTDADREAGVGLFRQAGAVITCTETVIFQWARRAGTELFRSLLPLVK